MERAIMIFAWLSLGVAAAVGIFHQMDRGETVGAVLCGIVVLVSSAQAGGRIEQWLNERRAKSR